MALGRVSTWLVATMGSSATVPLTPRCTRVGPSRADAAGARLGCPTRLAVFVELGLPQCDEACIAAVTWRGVLVIEANTPVGAGGSVVIGLERGSRRGRQEFEAWLNAGVPESFDDRDFSDAIFWGVQFQRARFRDADFSGSSFFHVLLRDASIDGEIDHLVINGVDVTDYVNRHDRWWPLRNRLSPDSREGILESWTSLGSEWNSLLARVAAAGPSVVDQSVNGEWTLSETLRHLIFAMDKWFTLPILGAQAVSAIGLPNTSSQGRPWPGLDPGARPDFEDVLAVRSAQHATFSAFVSAMQIAALPESVSVEENGNVPALMCFHVVLEEEFEHLRYMIRDVAALGVR